MNTLSEKPTTTTTTTTAMVSSSKSRRSQGQKPKHPKRKRSSQSRNQENSDNSDSDDNLEVGSKDKDSFMQCYYCCKHGYKVTECKLRERAKKLRNYQQQDSQKKAP